MRRLRAEHAPGFTLLELLVAISIFAIASWLSYGGLRQVLNGREALLPRMSQLALRIRAVSLIAGDLENVRPRVVRDALGGPQAALLGGGPSASLLDLTRGDAARALLADLPAVYRINYQLTAGRLERAVWPVLDRVPATRPQRQVLLTGVEQFSLRYFDGRVGTQWTDFWPPDSSGPGIERLPRGVEFTVRFADGTRVRRVVLPVAGQ